MKAPSCDTISRSKSNCVKIALEVMLPQLYVVHHTFCCITCYLPYHAIVRLVYSIDLSESKLPCMPFMLARVFTVCFVHSIIMKCLNALIWNYGKLSVQTNQQAQIYTHLTMQSRQCGALSGSPTTTIIQSFTIQYDHKYAAIFLHVCSESNNANDNKKISSGIRLVL